jgi:hypothetical protein
MVRIVSVANLGYGDYGGYFSDKEVDGVDYRDTREEDKESQSQDPHSKASKPTQLKGGRKSG